jgi:hypothetical protein
MAKMKKVKSRKETETPEPPQIMDPNSTEERERKGKGRSNRPLKRKKVSRERQDRNGGRLKCGLTVGIWKAPGPEPAKTKR